MNFFFYLICNLERGCNVNFKKLGALGLNMASPLLSFLIGCNIIIY